ncbi:CoxG family protein [Defluviimonas sp. SAOS-178_SWC]|uniref:CoxG family protein n=1 Tax=Defluviimonas sp. SAOS-178_SWC TaxID=3121287 RepID=UPI0032218318
MKIEKKFQVRASPDQVWPLLSDVSAVAECIPGFELKEEVSPGVYDGQFKLRVGPMSATLAGQGMLNLDEQKRIGLVEGKGVDRRGGSRATGKLQYAIAPVSGGTQVSIDADVQLSGPLAQVGRTGIVQDIADQLTAQFAANLEERLNSGAGSTGDASPVGDAATDSDAAPVATDGPTAKSQGARAPATDGRRAPADEFNAGSAFWSALLRRIAAFFGRRK